MGEREYNDDSDDDESPQKIDMREAPRRSVSVIPRSVSPLKQAKGSASERSNADVNVDELNALRTISNK